MKRILSVFLVFCMILSIVPISAVAEDYTITKKVSEKVASKSKINGTDYGSLVFIQRPDMHYVTWEITPEHDGLYEISVEFASVKGELSVFIDNTKFSSVYIENPGSTNNQGNRAYRSFGKVNLLAGRTYSFKVMPTKWFAKDATAIALYNIKAEWKDKVDLDKIDAEITEIVGSNNPKVTTSTTAGLYGSFFNMMNGATASVDFDVKKAGYYDIYVTAGSNNDSKGLVVTAGGITIKKDFTNTNAYSADGQTLYKAGFDNYNTTETLFGAVYLGKGTQTVSIKVPTANNVRVEKISIRKTTPYLQDNLVFHLDASNNTGNGFDENAIQWTDLASNTKVDINGNTWGKDSAHQDSYYLDVNGYIKLPEAVKNALSGDEWTVEFIVDSYPESLPEGEAARNIISLEGEAQESDSFLLCETVDGLKLTAFDQTLDTTVKAIAGVTNAITFDGSKLAVYTQGVENASSAVVEGESLNLDGFDLIFGADDGEFKANIRSIRVYNKALTEAELVRNSSADRNYYYRGIGADHAHIYDTKYSYDENAHWYGCAIAGCTSLGENLMDYGEHIFTGVDDADCNVCGYKRVTKLIDSYNVDIYEPETDINAAPIVMQKADSEIFDVSHEEKRPSALIFDVKAEDGILYAYDGDTKIGEFIALYETNKPKVNVGVRIYDMESADILVSWIHAERIGNLWVISDDVEILEKVTKPGKTNIVDGTLTVVGDSQTYRYVRIEGTNKYLGINELDVTGEEEADLLADATVSVGGTIVQGSVSRITDGSTKSETCVDYSADAPYPYIQVDLGEAKTITNIKYIIKEKVTTDSYRYNGERILLSNDPEFKEGVTTVLTVGDLGYTYESQSFPTVFNVDLSGEGEGIPLEFTISQYPTTYVRGIIDLTGKSVRGPANTTHNFDSNGDGTVDATTKTGEYRNGIITEYDYVTYEADEGSVYNTLSWDELYDLVFTLGYRTVLLDENDVTKDEMHYLHKAMLYVIAESRAENEGEFYNLIASGVNGILSENYNANINALESDYFKSDSEILIRPATIVAHRGDTDTDAPYSESTLKAIVSAGESGAEGIEFDIWMTLDGYLIVNHNDNINGYYDYPEDYEGERVASTKLLRERYWKGDLEHLVSLKDPEDRIPLLHELYEVVDTEYPDMLLFHEIKWSELDTVNRIIEHIDRYDMRSRSTMIAGDKNAVIYCNARGIPCQYLDLGSFGSIVTMDTDNRIYATEKLRRPMNDYYTTLIANTNADFIEELKHFGQISYPYTYETQSAIETGFAMGNQGMTVNKVHFTDDLIKKLGLEVDTESGAVKVTAHTLADKEKGTFDDNSVIVDEWWIDAGLSDGIKTYEVTDYEIFAVAGTPEIDNENKTVSGKAGDAVAVRYKQTLDNSSFYVYSNAVEFAPEETFAVVKNGSTNTFTISNYSEDVSYEFAYGSESAPDEEWQTVTSSTITATQPERYVWVRVSEGDAVVSDRMSESVTVTGTRLVLDGRIGIKVEYKYTENASDVKTLATFENSDGVIYNGISGINGQGYVILPIAPKDALNLSYRTSFSYTRSGEGIVDLGEVGNFSVTDMIARYKELALDEEENSYDTVLPLIEALEVYCIYADAYFNDTEAASLNFTSSEKEEIIRTAEPTLENGSIGNIKFFSTSLVLDDTVTIRHYFKVTGEIDTEAYVVDGAGEMTLSDGNSYAYVDVENVYVGTLDVQKEVKITYSEKEMTIKFSPLNYVKFIFDDEASPLTSLVCALYRYQKEAKEYMNASDIDRVENETENKQW